MMGASGGAANGTMLNPRWVELDFKRLNAPPARLAMQLGYERIPSTQVYGFKALQSFELQINRLAGDPYVVHVQVTVSRIGERPSCYAVTSASGRGERVVLPAGEYRIVCALGVAEQVNLELDVLTSPVFTYTRSLVADGAGDALISSQGSEALKSLVADGAGDALISSQGGSASKALVADGAGCGLVIGQGYSNAAGFVADGAGEALVISRDYSTAAGLVADGAGEAVITPGKAPPRFVADGAGEALVIGRDYSTAAGLVADGAGEAVITPGEVPPRFVADGAGEALCTVAPFEWVDGGPSSPCSGSWSVQVVDGVVQWNSQNPPASPEEAAAALLGVDGGDFELAMAWSYPPRCADGGDFDTGAPILYPFPQNTDGGDFDAPPVPGGRAHTLTAS
jgi:hypothetical protein